MEIGVPLAIAAVVLFAVGIMLDRQRRRRPEKPSGSPQEVGPLGAVDVVHPRPHLVELHVDGDDVKVRFDVPLGNGDDDVLRELLVQEAIDVVHEKQHTLPLTDVKKVVVIAGRGDDTRQVGTAPLDPPGTLPPRVTTPSILNLTSIAPDPLDQDFAAEPGSVPGTVEKARLDVLGPLADELSLPKAIDTGLRAQGIDPETMSAGQMIDGILAMFGYVIEHGADPDTAVATKAGERTFLRSVDHREGGHPELSEGEIRKFVADFGASGAARGLLVTEKYGPFAIYEWERRDPRLRFVPRERLQKFIDAMALG